MRTHPDDPAPLRRGIRARLLRASILTLLIYSVLSWILSSQLLTAPPRAAGVGPESPSRSSKFEKVHLDLDEGLRIPVWIAKPSGEPRGCVLLFHGRGGSHPEGRMGFVAKCGYVGIAPDFRAHGEAEGEFSGFGHPEQAEVRATLVLARRRWPDKPIVAWGFSMGAAAILLAADETSELSGVILESPFLGLERAFRNRFENQFPAWLFPITFGPLLFAQLRSGLWMSEVRPIEEIPRFRPNRVLLVQGALDYRVQMSEYEAYRAALPGLSGLVLQGLGHADFFWEGGKEYRAMLRRRLMLWMPQ